MGPSCLGDDGRSSRGRCGRAQCGLAAARCNPRWLGLDGRMSKLFTIGYQGADPDRLVEALGPRASCWWPMCGRSRCRASAASRRTSFTTAWPRARSATATSSISARRKPAARPPAPATPGRCVGSTASSCDGGRADGFRGAGDARRLGAGVPPLLRTRPGLVPPHGPGRAPRGTGVLDRRSRGGVMSSAASRRRGKGYPGSARLRTG
jgi:hypothetical protein